MLRLVIVVDLDGGVFGVFDGECREDVDRHARVRPGADLVKVQDERVAFGFVPLHGRRLLHLKDFTIIRRFVTGKASMIVAFLT